MDGDWARLALRLAHARKVSGLSQRAAAQALGVSRSTVQSLEDPKHTYAKVQLLHRSAARLYGWTERSIDAVLEGREPVLESGQAAEVPSVDGSQAAFETLTAGMSDRAVEALQRGRTIDTRVVDVTAGAQAVLIFKGGVSDASPEERLRYMRQWDALQRAALEIFSEQE